MRVIDCEQGTEEWFAARSGVPTASEFSKIITPPNWAEKFSCGNPACSHREEGPAQRCKKGTGVATPYRELIMGPSQSWEGYRNKILAEWKRGLPDDAFKSEWMKRGHEQEAAARRAYSFLTDLEVTQVGFCVTDDGAYGCSPDGLVNEDGGLEVKAPSPGIHVGYLLDGVVPSIYMPQVLGGLVVTGREWWDFVSYHPDFEPLIVRTYAADVAEELDHLKKALEAFCKDLERCKELLWGTEPVVFENQEQEPPTAAGIFG